MGQQEHSSSPAFVEMVKMVEIQAQNNVMEKY